MRKSVFLLMLSCLCALQPIEAHIEPGILRCEYLVNPLGIDTKTPEFSWTLISSQRNANQSAYEIIVSDNIRDIRAERGNTWSTGKVNSAANLQVRYDGKALKPFTRYFWRLRVTDSTGYQSSWSAVNWFETAMLEQGDWQGEWIGNGSKQPSREEDYYKDDPMPLFRKDFRTRGNIASARLYITGAGYYEAYLNGMKIGDQVLAPGWTAYGKEIQYQVFDITEMLERGSNAMGVMLGNGWWNPLPFKLFGRWDIRDYQQTGRPAMLAEIHIRYSDGRREKIVTDDSWKTHPGPVMRNNVYLGEHYDAGKEIEGWSSRNFFSTNWVQASRAGGPEGKLTAQLQAPVKITTVIHPESIKEIGKDTFIVDMGVNFAGVARIKVKGPAGTRISMRYGELLFEDGSVNLLTTAATQIKKGAIKGGPGAPETAWQQDTYTLKGKGVEKWSPRFTFHGFRYIEITGWPGRPSIEDIEGLRMNADLTATGEFNSSNDMFNTLFEVIDRTFKSNIFSVQSDCPGREKLGYGADIVVTAESFMYNYDMSSFYRKTVNDYANDQQDDGGITETAPFVGIADRGYGGASGPLGWQLAFPFLQKKLYEFYGDKSIVEKNYEGVKKQLDFLQSKAVDGLFHWDISDHEAIDPRPEAFTAACFYLHHASLAEEFAEIMDRKEDAEKYGRLKEGISNAIQRKYHVPSTGRFDNSTQSAQVFALWYGLASDEEGVMKVLLEEFRRHNWHVSSGIFGVKMMFDVLRLLDSNSVAYRIANQRDFPGWGFMLDNDATTLWETWKHPGTVYSANHPMFGSINEWFFRSLLGINAAEPGFKKIIIKPQPAGDLRWAKGSYQSVMGNISSSWKIQDIGFSLDISVPPNTSAEIWVKAGDDRLVKEGGKVPGNVIYKNGYAVVQVGSGNYSFTSTWKP